MAYIGVDIGGTTITAVKIDRRGKVLARDERWTQANKGKEQVISNITRMIESMFSGDVKAIGVGCPGPFKDRKNGIIGKQNNLPLENFNIKSYLQKRFKVDVYVENDADCFALCESMIGKGRGYDTVLGITLGTGMGSGLIIEGWIYRGRGNAFEFGSSYHINDGKKRLTFEEVLAKDSIVRLSRKNGIIIKDPIELYYLAKEGRRAAINIWSIYGKLLGTAISNLIMTVDPDIIVIGGNISGSWEFFKNNMKREADKLCTFKPCPIVRSTIKDAGAIGAALLSLKSENR